jgi:DNA repair exonuclease SbcCD nuclease subunit
VEKTCLDLRRKHGINEATFYNWKSKYGVLDVSEAKRLRALEGENAKLKRRLADAVLDNAALTDRLTKNGDARCQASKREAVGHLKGSHEMSERRARRVIGCQRMTVRYRSRRPDDARLCERLVALARERRQIGVVLQENILMNRSVRENIALADPGMSLDRVAAKSPAPTSSSSACPRATTPWSCL